jgi:hypothetical protein
MIILPRHGLDRLGHCWSFPPSKLGVSGQISYTVGRTDPFPAVEAIAAAGAHAQRDPALLRAMYGAAVDGLHALSEQGRP